MRGAVGKWGVGGGKVARDAQIRMIATDCIDRGADAEFNCTGDWKRSGRTRDMASRKQEPAQAEESDCSLC